MKVNTKEIKKMRYYNDLNNKVLNSKKKLEHFLLNSKKKHSNNKRFKQGKKFSYWHQYRIQLLNRGDQAA